MKVAWWVLTVLILIVALSTTAHEQSTTPLSSGEKGTSLYHACKTYASLRDTNGSSGGYLEFGEAGACQGYVDGFMNSYLWWHSQIGNDFCFDRDTTYEGIIRVYVLYMDKHPKLLDAPKYVGFMRAMQENYPCPTAEPK